MPPADQQDLHHPPGGETASLLPVRAPGTASAAAAAATAQRRPDFLLWCCRALNVVTAICELLCAIALGIAIALEAESADKVGRSTGQGQRRTTLRQALPRPEALPS